MTSIARTLSDVSLLDHRRAAGYISKIEDVGAVILEADGTFSMIEDLSDSASALADIPAPVGAL